MTNDIKDRLQEIGRLALAGYFGEDVKQATEDYQVLAPNAEVFVKIITDFYTRRSSEEDRLVFQTVEILTQLTIVVYRDTKPKDRVLATQFLLAFIQDYPNVSHSSLFQKWHMLTGAALAFKDAIHKSKSPVLVWEQAKGLFQAYNEFLSGILGYFIVCWRTVNGKTFSPNSLTNHYGVKLNEFHALTGGESGAFNLIFKIARPNIRNAIAHGTIWLEEDQGKVKFQDRGQTHEIGLAEFLGLAAIGSYVGTAYLAGVAAIIVIEEGNNETIAKLPAHLVSLYHHVPPSV